MKKLIALSLVLCMVTTLLVGCGPNLGDITSDILDGISDKMTEPNVDDMPDQDNQSGGRPSDEYVETDPVPSETEDKLTKSELCAKEFIEALQKEDYATALSYLDIHDSTFVSAEDLAWFIPRSDYADIPGNNGEISNVISYGEKTFDVIGLTVGQEDIEVPVFLNDDNAWKVDFEGFIITDWKILVPGDVSVCINGIEISNTYRVGKDDLQIQYVIPEIANRVAKISLKDTVFGDLEKDVLPSNESEITKVWFTFSEDEMADVYAKLQAVLNDMNESYENGATAADFTKYISQKANPQLAEQLYKYVNESYKWNSGLNPDNIRYKVVKGSTDVDNVEVFAAKLRTGNILILNLDVEKTWETTKYGVKSESTRVSGYLYVEYIDGEVYIYDVPADNFITARNSMTHDW